MFLRVLCLLLVATQLSAAHRCAIKINKARHELTLFVDGEPAAVYLVATGLNPKDKGCVGDMATPEGIFQVQTVEAADTWDHQFPEAAHAGPVRCYGPYFLRLSTKRDETFAQKSRWEGIGIHGTLERDLYSTDRSRVVCGPSALGAHSSEGCVRMHNSHLLDLIERIKRIDGDLLGLRVTIVDGVNRL